MESDLSLSLKQIMNNLERIEGNIQRVEDLLNGSDGLVSKVAVIEDQNGIQKWWNRAGVTAFLGGAVTLIVDKLKG